MAVKEFRNIFGGVIPKTSKVLAAENTVTAFGTPVALDADGKVTVCAADATAMIGWAISPGAADEAIDIVHEALERLEAEGVETNRGLLAAVLDHPDFVHGRITTHWLEEAIV